MSREVLLRAKGLSVGYGRDVLLGNLDLELRSGEVVALVGKNGVGKSTLLRTLMREQKPLNGIIYAGDVQIERMSRKELARHVAVVTTDRDISTGLTAGEIVSMGRHPHTDLFMRFSTHDHNVVNKAMFLTGITEKRDSFFGELSDGERQKVMIARALAQESPVMLLDEPFSYLDTAARIEILALLKRLARSSGVAILLSSHDVAQALRMADVIWLLTPDRELHRGSPEQLIHSGVVERLFDTTGVCFDPRQNDFVEKEDF